MSEIANVVSFIGDAKANSGTIQTKDNAAWINRKGALADSANQRVKIKRNNTLLDSQKTVLADQASRMTGAGGIYDQKKSFLDSQYGINSSIAGTAKKEAVGTNTAQTAASGIQMTGSATDVASAVATKYQQQIDLINNSYNMDTSQLAEDRNQFTENNKLATDNVNNQILDNTDNLAYLDTQDKLTNAAYRNTIDANHNADWFSSLLTSIDPSWMIRQQNATGDSLDYNAGLADPSQYR